MKNAYISLKTPWNSKKSTDTSSVKNKMQDFKNKFEKFV